MLRKATLLIILLSSIFFVTPALAIDTSGNIPALNPFCWRKADCLKVREDYLLGNKTDKDYQEKLESGFISNASTAPCNTGEGDDQWGRCLPAGVTKTEISFGGESKFSNIGDFILLMYKYLVSVASIVAVIMIVIAGFQWITSGGNSEGITSAKHRISGAVIGLFIAYMSYFILHSINPALVNFRLPQVWLIRPQTLMPEFCNQVPGAASGTTQFFYYAGETDQTSAVNPKAGSKDPIKYGLQKDGDQFVFGCGRRFLAEDGGAQACFGKLCPSQPGNRQVCAKDLGAKEYVCQRGDLRINFSIDDSSISEQIRQGGETATRGLLVSKLMEANWLQQNTIIRGVCKNEAFVYLSGQTKTWSENDSTQVVESKSTPGSPYQSYTRAYGKLADFENEGWDCGGGTLVGYFIRILTKSSESGVDALKRISAYTSVVGSFLFSGDSCEEPNLNIGYNKKTGTAVFGAYGQDIKNFNYYIPIEELKNGLQLNVSLDIDSLERMIAYCGSYPGRERIFPEPIE